MATFPINVQTAARNAAGDAIVDLVDAGSAAGRCIIRNASAQALFTAEMATTAFGDTGSVTPGLVSGTVPGSANPGSTVADGTVTDRVAVDAILEDSDSNLVTTLTVGESGADLNLADDTVDGSVTIPIGATVTDLPLNFTVNFP